MSTSTTPAVEQSVETAVDTTVENKPKRRPRRPRHPHHCARGCNWISGGTCHCARCHLLFGSVTAFDKHLRHEANGDLTHLDPIEVGLELRESQGDVAWRLPVTDAKRAQLAALRARNA